MFDEYEEINSIEIGIAPSEYFYNISVVEITSVQKFEENSVYDTKMGPLDNLNCKTCFAKSTSCVGHFGHINLSEPVLNPLFSFKLIAFLKNICLNCGFKFSKMKKSFEKNYCTSCNFENYQIVEKNGVYYQNDGILNLRKICEVLKNLNDDDLTSFGFNKISHPKNYIMTILPVMSHIHRPYMTQGSQICDDDLTSIYLNILKINLKIAKENTRDTKSFSNLYEKLVFEIKTLFTNSHGKSFAYHPSSGRKINSIVERFNGKNGLPRNNILGKRVDESGRAVAAPGNLKTGELGLPKTLANILTRRILCTESNIEELQKYCDENKIDRVYRILNKEICEFSVAKFCNKKQTKLEPKDLILKKNSIPIKVCTGREILEEGDLIVREGKTIIPECARFKKFEIKIGDYVSRYLQDGDIILANRQPTLHTGSMSANNIKLHNENVIRLPLSMTYRLNLDFDGDEVNIHTIQSENGIQELEEIAHANKTIISSSTGQPFITVVQDTVLGLYLLSKSNFKIDMDILNEREIEIIKSKNNNSIPSSFDLISLEFPKDFCLQDKLFLIKNGLWVRGTCDKHATIVIIKKIYKTYGANVCCNLIDYWQSKIVYWLTIRGFSINANDFIPMDKIYVNDKIKQLSDFESENENTIRDSLHFESIEKFNNNNILECIKSGAKGTLINFGQIMSCIGQQKYGKNLKITPTLSKNRILVSDDYLKIKTNFDKLIYNGFIKESYASGLSYRSLAIASFASRYCLILGKNASMSGYLQRQAAKSLEDICVYHHIYNDKKFYQIISKSSINPYVVMNNNYNNNLNPFF